MYAAIPAEQNRTRVEASDRRVDYEVTGVNAPARLSVHLSGKRAPFWQSIGSPWRLEAAYQAIENYGVIGDTQTVALVGANGSIDWFCFQRSDSPSVFGAILDDGKGGYFRISSQADEITHNSLGLASPVPVKPEDNGVTADLTPHEGQKAAFVLKEIPPGSVAV